MLHNDCLLQLVILDAHGRKKAEEADFKAALQSALAEQDAEGRALVAGYNKVHKHAMCARADSSASEDKVGGCTE